MSCNGTAGDALEWMRDQCQDDGRILFRGQTRFWPSIKPSITRDDDATKRSLWAICCEFHTWANGITGFRIKPRHDRLTILQHYMLRSPVIDLTGTPEIALYFAIRGAIPGQECVVFSVDRRDASSDGVVFSDHAFLILPPDEGGLRHRWVRQDGYTVGPEEWWRQDVVDNFDLLGFDGISCMRFTRQQCDDRLVDGLGDLESTTGDPLARKVRWMVKAIARRLNLLTPKIQRVLEATKTIDPDDELAVELDKLIDLAQATSDSKALAVLDGLKASHQDGIWDTGFTASLLWARDRLLVSGAGSSRAAESAEAPDPARCDGEE